MKLFCAYDSKAECYTVPFFMQTTGAAIRAFADQANDQNSIIGRHPGDFTLYELGSWSDHNAHLAELDPHINLGKAIEHVQFAPAPVPTAKAHHEHVTDSLENDNG